MATTSHLSHLSPIDITDAKKIFEDVSSLFHHVVKNDAAGFLTIPPASKWPEFFVFLLHVVWKDDLPVEAVVPNCYLPSHEGF